MGRICETASILRLIDWLFDLLIDGSIVWFTDWLIDWSIDWLSDLLIDWLIDWLDRSISFKFDSYSTPFSFLFFHQLSEYAQRVIQPNRVAVTGTNITHDEILNFAQKYLKFENVGDQKANELIPVSKVPGADIKPYRINASNITDKPAKYIGGDILEDTIDHLAYAAFVTEGPGLNKPKELITLKLMQQVIGTEPHIKWSTGQNVSELSKAAAATAQNPCAVSGVTFTHADSSLAGFSVVSHAKDLPNILKAGLEVLRGKSGVDEKRLQAAKWDPLSDELLHWISSIDWLIDLFGASIDHLNDWSVDWLIDWLIWIIYWSFEVRSIDWLIWSRLWIIWTIDWLIDWLIDWIMWSFCERISTFFKHFSPLFEGADLFLRF